MNTIRDRLKIVIENSGYSLRGFAREVGISPGGLSGILSGRTSAISGMFLKVVESRFSISSQWLRMGEGPMFASTFLLVIKEEIDLVEKFRGLARDQQKSLLMMADALYTQRTNSADNQQNGQALVAEKNRKKIKNWQ